MDDVIAGGEKERVLGGMVGGFEQRRTWVDKLPMRPQESIWTPPHHHHPHPLLLSGKGHGATQPHILITDEPPLWPRTVGYNMALRHRHTACHLPSLSTVIMEETLQDAVLDRPPETF